MTAEATTPAFCAGKGDSPNGLSNRINYIGPQSLLGKCQGWPEQVAEWGERTYVGHAYLIWFNAWTYAKANLWASLMQTVFIELNRQLTLETTLVDVLAQAALMEEGWPEPEPTDKFSPEREARREELKRSAWLAANDLWSKLLYAGEEEQQLLLETTLGRKALGKWLKKQVSTDTLWTYLQRQTEAEMDQLKTLREELAQKRADLAARAIWTPILTQLQRVLTESALKQLREEVNEGDAEALAALAELTPNMGSVFNSMVQHPLNTLVITLFAGIVVAVPYLLDLVQWPRLVVVALAVGISIGQAVLRLQARLNGIRGEYWTNYEAELERLEAGKTRFFELPELRELSETVVELEAQVRQQEERVGLTSRCRSLHELVQSRLDEGYYEKRLGLMHRVERDLTELTDALYIRLQDHPATIAEKRKSFPRGQPRIVLFIDDLDRCPPDRVVEVLEAVQLLLKTRLFVVVLGLDTRYVTRALEKAYEGILMAQGAPSGLDYIEKIMTLPYRVHKVSPETVARFLEGQKMEVMSEEPTTGVEEEAEPEDAVPTYERDVDAGETAPRIGRAPVPPEALPPEAVAFSPLEYDTIQKTCQKIKLTPRSLKRITNVMKLIKIFWHRAGISTTRAEVQTVVALLALSAQYPEVMRDAFELLGARRRSEEEIGSLTWHNFFKEFVSTHRSRNLHLDVRAQEFLDDVQAAIAERIEMGDVNTVHVQLARSFSFVGDPTSAVEPATKVELVNR